jgi:hypothetical protein
MGHRRIVTTFKTGKVTLLQARKAAAAVKSVRLKKSAKKSARSKLGSQSVRSSLAKRYLGYFGSGRPKTDSYSRRVSGTNLTAEKEFVEPHSNR